MLRVAFMNCIFQYCTQDLWTVKRTIESTRGQITIREKFVFEYKKITVCGEVIEQTHNSMIKLIDLVNRLTQLFFKLEYRCYAHLR